MKDFFLQLFLILLLGTGLGFMIDIATCFIGFIICLISIGLIYIIYIYNNNYENED